MTNNKPKTYDNYQKVMNEALSCDINRFQIKFVDSIDKLKDNITKNLSKIPDFVIIPPKALITTILNGYSGSNWRQVLFRARDGAEKISMIEQWLNQQEAVLVNEIVNGNKQYEIIWKTYYTKWYQNESFDLISDVKTQNLEQREKPIEISIKPTGKLNVNE